MANTQQFSIQIQMLAGSPHRPPTVEEIASALRLQADALWPSTGLAAKADKPAKRTKKKEIEEENGTDSTDSDSSVDEDLEASGDDNSSDADSEAVSEAPSEESGVEDYGSIGEDDTEEAGPSKADCIGLLNKVAAGSAKNLKQARELIKKHCGVASIQQAKPKTFASLAKALKAELKNRK